MRRLLLLLLALGLTACSRCGKTAGPAGSPTVELARRLPRAAGAVVLVPDVGVFGEKAALLQQLKVASFLAQLQGFGSAEEYTDAVVGQIGVDVRSRDELRKAGMEPDRGLAVALLPGGRAYSVVGVRDAQKLQETLSRLARDRIGAGVVARKSEGGQTLVTFSRQKDGSPELGLVVKGSYAFIAAGASVSELPAWASLSSSASLAEDSAYVAGVRRLPAERDFLAHVPAASAQAERYLLAGASFAGRLSREGLTLWADVPWHDIRSTLDVLTPQEGPSLVNLLPEDAFLVARFAGDPLRLAPFWSLLTGSPLERAVREAGFDIKADVLANLRPGQVLALGLSPTARLAGGMPALDVRRTNPFHFLHLTAAATVKEPARAMKVLERVPPFAARLGARMEPAERAGHKVYLTSYWLGEGAHLALKGSTLLVASPEQRLLDALAKVDQAAPGAGPLSDPALGKQLAGRGAVVVVDFPRLVGSVKALPSEAWGVGGFAIKAATVRWLEAMDDVRTLTLGLSAKDGAVQAELSLSLRASGEGR